MSAVAAFGATAPSAARVGARFGRGGEVGSTWRRARALPRAVARSAAADVEAMASVTDAETGAADDDDLRFVYVGNFDFFTLEGTIETAVRDALGEALRDRVRSMAVPGWRDKRLADGTLKPRKKRDEGKRNRGFAVLEFDAPETGRAAADALNGVVFEARALRSSAGVRADVRGAPKAAAARKARRRRASGGGGGGAPRAARTQPAPKATQEGQGRRRAGGGSAEPAHVAPAVRPSRSIGDANDTNGRERRERRRNLVVERFARARVVGRRGGAAAGASCTAAGATRAGEGAGVRGLGRVRAVRGPGREQQERGTARGLRKRLQVESFRGILVAAKVAATAARGERARADADANATTDKKHIPRILRHWWWWTSGAARATYFCRSRPRSRPCGSWAST